MFYPTLESLSPKVGSELGQTELTLIVRFISIFLALYIVFRINIGTDNYLILVYYIV